MTQRQMQIYARARVKSLACRDCNLCGSMADGNAAWREWAVVVPLESSTMRSLNRLQGGAESRDTRP